MRSFDGRGEARPLALAALLSIAPGCHSTSTYEGTPAPAAQASSPPLATSSPPSPSSPTAAVPSEHHATDPLLAHELVEYQAAPRELWGFLFRPPGPGPFPAMIFNHGSEELPGPKLGQAQFYVPQGFVVFVPHRRGQGRSKDAGPYIDTKADDPKAFVDELVAQSDDVLAAIDYIAAQPYVNPKQIAVSGGSLGGIETLLAAERSNKIAAAIDFAGGAMMWKKMVPLQERMKAAAANAKVPVFFIQAENDFDTTPSRVLSAEMQKLGKPTRVHIFPPSGATAEDGHWFGTGGENPPWGAEVLQFLADTMLSRANVAAK